MCDEDHCDAGCKKPGKPTEVITWLQGFDVLAHGPS